MLFKLYCWLFGHNFYAEYFTGKTVELTDRLTGQLTTRPVNHMVEKPLCQRCGTENATVRKSLSVIATSDRPYYEEIKANELSKVGITYEYQKEDGTKVLLDGSRIMVVRSKAHAS